MSYIIVFRLEHLSSTDCRNSFTHLRLYKLSATANVRQQKSGSEELMITRIFRVKIDPSLREEFESRFSSISIDAVQKQKGFISVEIGKPTK